MKEIFESFLANYQARKKHLPLDTQITLDRLVKDKDYESFVNYFKKYLQVEK